MIDLSAAETLAREMSAVLNRATRWGDVDQGSRELLRQRGELSFDSLLPAAIKAGLRTLGGEAAAAGDEAKRRSYCWCSTPRWWAYPGNSCTQGASSSR